MGKKSTFRLLNRGSAKALDKVAELYGIIFTLPSSQLAYLLRKILRSLYIQKQERRFCSWRRQYMISWAKWFGLVIFSICKVIRNDCNVSVIDLVNITFANITMIFPCSWNSGDSILQRTKQFAWRSLFYSILYLSSFGCILQEIPILNPVYLMLGASFGSAAKGTGLKALEFALSICDTVDMYGFTVDPGYKEWYVAESIMLLPLIFLIKRVPLLNCYKQL